MCLCARVPTCGAHGDNGVSVVIGGRLVYASSTFAFQLALDAISTREALVRIVVIAVVCPAMIGLVSIARVACMSKLIRVFCIGGRFCVSL